MLSAVYIDSGTPKIESSSATALAVLRHPSSISRILVAESTMSASRLAKFRS